VEEYWNVSTRETRQSLDGWGSRLDRSGVQFAAAPVTTPGEFEGNTAAGYSPIRNIPVTTALSFLPAALANDLIVNSVPITMIGAL
jgi:hypothetical protein